LPLSFACLKTCSIVLEDNKRATIAKTSNSTMRVFYCCCNSSAIARAEASSYVLSTQVKSRTQTASSNISRFSRRSFARRRSSRITS
jgi:hypothetical protein